MAEYEIIHNFSNEGTRNEVRMRVVELLSTEEPEPEKEITLQDTRIMWKRYKTETGCICDGRLIYIMDLIS